MNLFDKATQFAISAAAFVKAGMPICTKEQIAGRLAICDDCDHYDPEAYAEMGECKICGCNMEIKSVMATESCPAGKWKKLHE
jgi:hypothetical protein